MSNGIPKINNNGMGGVLTTLASSGDNWVKLFIIGGIILNTYWTKNNGKGISDNGAEVGKLREQVARQVKVIHGNQKIYLEGISEARLNHQAIMDKLGIWHPNSTPYPRPTPEEGDEDVTDESGL